MSLKTARQKSIRTRHKSIKTLQSIKHSVNARLLSKIYIFASELLDRKLDDKEMKKLVSFAEENIKYVEYQDEIELIAVLSDAYVDYLANNKINKESFESSKKSNTTENTGTQNLASFFDLTSFDKFIENINPAAKRKKAYMCLDTKYARFLNNNTKVQWDFTNTAADTQNFTSIVGGIRDIVYIRMYSIVIPQFSSTVARASVLIEEMSGQSFILPNGRRFHFISTLNNLNNPVPLDSRNSQGSGHYIPDFTIYDKYELLSGFRSNDGFYRFHKPITTLNTITVSIGDPFNVITLPKYQFDNVTVSTTGISWYAITDPDTGIVTYYNAIEYIYLDFPEPHGYSQVYSLFIDDWSSDNNFDYGNNPFNDNLISRYNTYEFTTISVISSTRIRIQPAYSNIAGWHAGSSIGTFLGDRLQPLGNFSKVKVRFNSYRIIMNFEMEYMVE